MGAGAYFGLRIVRETAGGSAGPMFWLITGFGLAALLLILAAGFYSARKRLLQERVGGTMMAWLKSHLYLGALALLVAVAHWLLFPLTAEITSGKIALILLGVLVASGIAWRVVYLRVPLRVPDATGNLSIRDTRERVADLRAELEKTKVGRSRAFQQAVDVLASGEAAPDEVAGLDDEERSAWTHATELGGALDAESRRERRQRRLSRLLQSWRILHLPLALAVVVAVGFHLYDVFEVGASFEEAEETSFASADDCASCHADVVDEWKISPHRMAQTSTITRAQTLLALEKNPQFRKDCVNCHAPIGTKFSSEETFPLAEDPGLNPDSATTEGITCVVCHTLEEHPRELEGFTDDIPVAQRGRLDLGKMFGPVLEDHDALPNSAHDIGEGFMTDPVASSQMCGACHNVAADLDGNGLGEAGPESPPEDSDDDRVLDENEIDAETDLVLQTTFDEWEDYIFEEAGLGASCVECHMPPVRDEIASDTPLLDAPERDRNRHVFVGVDYELDTAYYEQKGMPEDALQRALEEREALLARAVSVSVKTERVGDELLARVKIENQTGHSFPTGFAFVRQFWLEVSATDEEAQPVCLADREGLESPCVSGGITEADEDLQTCDVEPIADGVDVDMLSVFPEGDCDPWLVNLQKILTNADADGTSKEVPYQSKEGGVVKDRVRAVTDPRTDEVDVFDAIPQGRSRSFSYVFELDGVDPQDVTVKATLRHRHLAPYFVRALDPYFTDDDPTAAELLENMTIVDVASTEPLGDNRTSPSPATLAATGPTEFEAMRDSTNASATWAALPLATVLLGLPVVALGRRRRR